MRTKLTLILTLWFTVLGVVSAQELPRIIPPSPEAAGIAKYTDIPIGHYTGTTQITVPLMQASSRDIVVPVSVSYHGAGIRVEEKASRIGLGWNLMAGGQISRSVRGKPDDRPNSGFLNTTATVSDFTNAQDKLVLINAALEGVGIDYESDIYNFSFLGHSGKFTFRQNGEVVLIPHAEYRIEKRVVLQEIVGWTITDPNGYKYYFGSIPNQSSVARDKSEVMLSYNSQNPTFNLDFEPDFYSSWHLLKVESPISDATVTFDYINVEHFSLDRSAESRMFAFIGQCSFYPGLNTTFTYTRYNESVLSAIHFDDGTIDFQYGNQRADSDGDIPLTSLTLKNTFGQQKKKIELAQSYFISDTPQLLEIPSAITVNSQVTHRLRLDKIIEKGQDDLTPLEHTFDYYYDPNQLKLPHRFSKAQDFWGFYNNEVNTWLIPAYYDLDNGWAIPGANRRVNENFSYANALKSIIYPSGGKSEFKYESNRVINSEQSLNSFFPLAIESLASLNYVVNQSSSLSSNFSITNEHLNGFVEYKIERTGCTDPLTSLSCGMDVKIQGITDSGFTTTLNDLSGNRVLPIGSYQLVVSYVGGDISTADIHIKAFKNNSPGNNGESLVGGIRIKEILLSDGSDSTLLKELKYINPVTNEGSGKLASENFVFFETGVQYCTDVQLGTPTANQITSFSILPSLSMGGSHVGYQYVTENQFVDEEFYDNATSSYVTERIRNGYTSYEFSFADDMPSTRSNVYPFTPYTTFEWKKGNLLKKEVFSLTGEVAKKIYAETNTYDYYDLPSDPYFKEVVGVKFGKRGSMVYYDNYSTRSEVFNLKQTKTEQFFDNGQLTRIQTDYTYENSYLRPSKTTVYNSNGRPSINRTKYTDDTFGSELSTAEKAVLTSMVSANMLLPVLSESFIDNESTPLSKSLTVFGSQSAKFLPVEQKIWNRESSTYESRLTFGYDGQYNYELVTKDGSQKVAYIWGYGNTLPVAQVNDGTPGEIAFSSFESTSTGGWTYGGTTTAASNLPTGVKYYTLTGNNVTKTGLTSNKKYVVSYWAKDGVPSVNNVIEAHDAATANGFGWKYYEKIVSGTGTITISGTAKIDELRLYPLGAQMSTYTYEPLRGLTSQTSPNGITMYYFYDDFGRLEYVKDRDGNILKKNEYKYQVNAINTNN